MPITPVRLTLPTIVLGLTITGGLGIIFAGVTEMTQLQLNPAAITWIVIFSMATLFGCTALLLRFWSKVLLMNRETQQEVHCLRPGAQIRVPEQLPQRLESVPSVTEHTTRTFSAAYRKLSDPEER